MRMFGVVLAIGLAAAPAAMAQQAPADDPIGSILAQPAGRAAATPDEPDTAAASDATPDPEPTVAAPRAAAPVAPPPKLDRPVQLEETGRNPDTPSLRDLAYDSRIRASFASAQSFQGPLDGNWLLGAAGQGDLYAFKLVDKGRGEVEGAWRDLGRKGALDGSGFIDSIERTDADVVLRFTAADGRVTVSLEPAAGGWSGQLQQGTASRRVTLRRQPGP